MHLLHFHWPQLSLMYKSSNTVNVETQWKNILVHTTSTPPSPPPFFFPCCLLNFLLFPPAQGWVGKARATCMDLEGIVGDWSCHTAGRAHAEQVTNKPVAAFLVLTVKAFCHSLTIFKKKKNQKCSNVLNCRGVLQSVSRFETGFRKYCGEKTTGGCQLSHRSLFLRN